MATAFSSDGEAVLRRELGPAAPPPAPRGDLDGFYEMGRAAAFVRDGGFRKVALQLPDELLVDAATVAARMEAETGAEVYVLGDTTYGSCCVDEVAAEHACAEAVLHYGPACLSPCRKLPVLHIFGKQPLDIGRCAEAFRELYADRQSRVVVLSDVVYAHAMGELEQQLCPEYPNIIFSRVVYGDPPAPALPGEERQFGRQFLVEAPGGLQDCAMFFVGTEGLTLTNFMLTWNRCSFSSFDPTTNCGRQETLNVNRALMRRLYLVERARDARVVGILVGTLGVAGYLDVLQHLRELLRRAGKRSYTLAVGKPNPAKLANFLEVDVFVLVACAQNSLLDSSDFYRPVVTPYELELACNPAREWTGNYLTDFRDLLPGAYGHVELPPAIPAAEAVPDLSLITGEMRATHLCEPSASQLSPSTALACRDQTNALAEISPAASFLESRSWRGLEQQLGQTPVSKAVQGRRGIAIAYEDEGREQS
ncbi:2-(3-amino-3-carboxypropyl)histidine synthase subunit 2 [Pezoporus wallicus]|uniref:2-(3-amino-3-carboxypropyl)histidine synthase subunit 2 n=1 Tax=Pezoporus wallicus TaxID=35540 RepID=UPI00254D7E33|nr:2-(3-amino-3-carboxypropyl)histidine synthase subunit 2 [Pezoporus wallicus]XP_061307445.1 2-(3-amino-3-carboxypropyl)histidine synthase subunit 2 [Pezoporus flaviventris]